LDSTDPLGSPEIWEESYRDGAWGHLGSIGEIAHYMTLLGYATYARQPSNVLDMGCGTGRLLQLFEHVGFGSYRGVDFSHEAINRAAALSIDNTRFEVADFATWDTNELYDVVVFNESLYYASDPHGLARRSLRWLSADGLLTISMFRHDNVERIWRAIDADHSFATVEATRVENHRAQVWDIRALQARSGEPSA
jgi:trans-aconitate methyltransferase